MEQSIGSLRLFYISPSSAIAERNNSGIIACGCWYYPQTNDNNLPNTFRIYPTPFIIYPTPSEFTQHLHNLPNTFRIYPTPSEFTQHLQNLPTPSDFTHHLHNLPTTFRIYPPPSEFTHPPAEQIGFGAVGPFCTLLDLLFDPNNVGFDKNGSLVR